MDRFYEIERPRRRPKPVLRSYWPFWLISVLHVIVALSYKLGAGLSITPHPLPGEQSEYWDTFPQALPIESLRGNLASSIWGLHSQSPMQNIYGGVLAKFFYPNHLEWMHYINIVMGACIPAMAGVIVWRITRNKFGGLLAALIYALNPSLFLYEAHPTGTLPAAFLVTAPVFCLAMFCPDRKVGWLYALVAIANLLVLTTSAYHLAVLLAVVGFVVMLVEGKRFRVLAICLLISGVSIGWYSKNYAMFGSFGSGSPSAIGSMRDDPKAYFRNAARGYQAFCVPSSQYLPVSRNAMKISGHEWVSSRVVQGQWLCEYLSDETGATEGVDIFRSLLFFILPLTVLGYLFSAIRRCGIRPGAWGKMISRDPAVAMAMFLIVYSTVVCCMAEPGENMRFKFLIESLLWAVPLGFFSRLFQRRRLAGDDLEWAGPSD